jgi:hypothetical protein
VGKEERYLTYGCEGNLADAEADGDQAAHWSERHGVDLLFVLDDLENMRNMKQKDGDESGRRYSVFLACAVGGGGGEVRCGG